MKSVIDHISQERVYIGLEAEAGAAKLILECRSKNTRVEKTFFGKQRSLAINAYNGMSLAAVDDLFGDTMRNIQVVPMMKQARAA